MNFLRLTDELVSLLFEDDDIIAIDKPYGFNTHTNESKAGNEEHIQHGLIEIFERQLGRPLHIIHRLDQTTTGVVIFGKSQDSAKKYADFFFNRLVKKTYLFVTASNRSLQKSFEIDQDIVQKGKDLTAQTKFSLLKNSAKFALWQANPLTGRNHQIRIHAAAGEIPILGDERYGGQRFPFICLHNRKIEFPNGIVIESTPPLYFSDLTILDNLRLTEALHEADRRTRLFSGTNLEEQCFRVAHKQSDSNDSGYTIDQFGKLLMMAWYNERWSDSDKSTFAQFASHMHKPLFVRHAKEEIFLTHGSSSSNGAEALSDSGASANWVAKEGALKFELQSGVGAAAGLFLDQRLHRKWIVNNSLGKSVLNLFSYNCGFGVAAATGGASEVVSIDSGKANLSRGKRNFEINGIQLDHEPAKYKFLCRDSLAYIDMCHKKSVKFDLVICHAPAFFRGEKKAFRIESDLETLLKNCLDCLKPKGSLLFLTNAQNFFIDDIRRAILKVQKEMGKSDLQLSSILPGLDFELVGERPRLKSFLIG
jgi:23S rRNA (cytosine1962-C5)-methyltransferase